MLLQVLDVFLPGNCPLLTVALHLRFSFFLLSRPQPGENGKHRITLAKLKTVQSMAGDRLSVLGTAEVDRKVFPGLAIWLHG